MHDKKKYPAGDGQQAKEMILKRPIKLKENTEDGEKAPVIKINWILISVNERFLAEDYHPLKTTEALSKVRQVRRAGCMPWEILISQSRL